MEGVKNVDYSSDADHNRSVLSYLGQPEAVPEATKVMALIALELVDMSKHQGSHPRMGAVDVVPVDVVPFIPIRGMETEETIEIARQFGRFLVSTACQSTIMKMPPAVPSGSTWPRFAKGSTRLCQRN